jgi:hypothetical protein
MSNMLFDRDYYLKMNKQPEEINNFVFEYHPYTFPVFESRPNVSISLPPVMINSS